MDKDDRIKVIGRVMVKDGDLVDHVVCISPDEETLEIDISFTETDNTLTLISINVDVLTEAIKKASEKLKKDEK